MNVLNLNNLKNCNKILILSQNMNYEKVFNYYDINYFRI